MTLKIRVSTSNRFLFLDHATVDPSADPGAATCPGDCLAGRVVGVCSGLKELIVGTVLPVLRGG